MYCVLDELIIKPETCVFKALITWCKCTKDDKYFPYQLYANESTDVINKVYCQELCEVITDMNASLNMHFKITKIKDNLTIM